MRKQQFLLAFILSLFVLGGFGAWNVHAQETSMQKQTMQYDVYAGGLHALQAALDIDLSEAGRYDVTTTAQTYGLLNKIVPWTGRYQTQGWVDGGFKAQTHQSTSLLQGEKKSKRYEYNQNGEFLSYSLTEGEKDKTPEKIPAKLTHNSSDILSEALNMMQRIASDQECGESRNIFDGKRSFKLQLHHKRQVELKKSRYNLYEGSAVECTIEVEPVAGKWSKEPRGWLILQEQGRERGQLPTVWFAKMADGQPAVPVKIRVKTSYGTLFMHMTGYQNGTRNLKLEK